MSKTFDIESELNGLDPKSRSFVIRVCHTYTRGILPQDRERYKIDRRTSLQLAKKLERLRHDLQKIVQKAENLPDAIRAANIPPGSYVPITYAVGLEGPLEFFEIASRRDPALKLANLLGAISEVETFLLKESRRMKNRAPRIKPLWKTRPIIWWQKGGLEYILDRIFRAHLKLTIPESHNRIINIRYKLDGKQLTFDIGKRSVSGIDSKIASMPRSYKSECDRVIAALTRSKCSS